MACAHLLCLATAHAPGDGLYHWWGVVIFGDGPHTWRRPLPLVGRCYLFSLTCRLPAGVQRVGVGRRCGYLWAMLSFLSGDGPRTWRRPLPLVGRCYLWRRPTHLATASTIGGAMLSFLSDVSVASRRLTCLCRPALWFSLGDVIFLSGDGQRTWRRPVPLVRRCYLFSLTWCRMCEWVSRCRVWEWVSHV